ncbi:hypothetical protein EsH8_II_000896 [Colletotrichum jinshuiense]
MKSVVFFGLGLLSASVAVAQGSLATCANNCVQSMQGLASALGCTSGDTACLCRNPNFSYGIRDCSYQSCTNAADAEQAVSFGIDLCRQAGVAVTASPGATTVATQPSGAGTATVTQPAGTATVTASPIVSSVFSTIVSGGSTITTFVGLTTIVPTASGGGDGESATPSPVSTSTFTTIITSGGSTFTSVGETTLFGIGGVPGATSAPQTAVTTAPIVSTITSDGSVITSTIGSTTLFSSLTGSAASSALSSQASEASSASGTQTGSATSSSTSGLACKQTAVPAAGFLAAAGLAAMLL